MISLGKKLVFNKKYKILKRNWLFVIFTSLVMMNYNILIDPNPVLCAQDNSNSRLLIQSNIRARILFDEAHYPICGIAGKNICYGSDDAYSNLAELLQNEGYSVDTLDNGEEINSENLENCDVLVFAGPMTYYQISEIDYLTTWVTNGGSLLLISDWGPIFQTIPQTIASIFGFHLGRDSLRDLDDNNGKESSLIFNNSAISTHVITNQINRIETYAQDGIICKPETAISLLTTDNDNTTYWLESNEYANDIPILCINEKWNNTNGKIALITDSSIFANNDVDQDGTINLFDSDNEILILNLINWLSNFRAILPVNGLVISFLAVFGILVFAKRKRNQKLFSN